MSDRLDYLQGKIREMQTLQAEYRKQEIPTNRAAVALYTNDVSGPPTEAQLTSAFGTPASAGVGKMFLLADAGSTSSEYLCISDGATWQILVLTKAV